MGDGGAPNPTEASFSTHLQRVSTLLRNNDRGADADALRQLLDAPAPAKPSVFVAGEAKRGKSSLVNALLGKPGLSPVGVDAATAVPVTFYWAERPEARLYCFGEAAPLPADLSQAQASATIHGDPSDERNVRGVAIGTDAPLLRTLDLVDTPGVGGLDSGHAAMTMEALGGADALIFVIEAGAQIRAAELRFLRQASARVDTVVLVLTKIDAHRGWRTILDDNLAVLRERAPRFASCPIVPVSTLLARRALEHPEDADELRGESGIAQLEEVLTAHVVARAPILRKANVVRAGLGSIAALERTLQQRLAALQAGPAGRERLEAEQARLRDLNRTRAEWPQTLDLEFRKLTLERQELVARRIAELRRGYEERLKDLAKRDYDALPGELIADLTALGSSVNEMTAARLDGIVHNLLEGIDRTSTVEQAIAQLTGQSLREEIEGMRLSAHGMTHLEKLSLFGSFSTGRSMGSLLSGSGLGLTATAFVAPPVALALGFAVGGLFAFSSFRTKKNQLFANEFKVWMRDQISQAQLMINNSFTRGSIDLQAQIRGMIRDAIAEREREITDALAAAKAIANTEATERQQAQKGLQQRLENTRLLGTQAVALLTSLSRESVTP